MILMNMLLESEIQKQISNLETNLEGFKKTYIKRDDPRDKMGMELIEKHINGQLDRLRPMLEEAKENGYALEPSERMQEKLDEVKRILRDRGFDV